MSRPIKNQSMKLIASRFCQDDLPYLGEWGRRDNVDLYDVPNNPETIKRVKAAIDEITKKYRLIIHSPKESFTNIGILDIDL